MLPETLFTDKNIETRFKKYYGKDRDFSPGQIPTFREKWESLSEFMREINRSFQDFIIKGTIAKDISGMSDLRA